MSVLTNIFGPISLYLFFIVMAAFISMLQHRNSQGQFTFHPKCLDFQISHLVFADDLFVLCGADIDSYYQVVKGMLDDFYLYSGLRLNMDKSTIFFAGLWKRFIYIIFSDEFFLVKYLCVPLITTRLDFS